MQPTTRRALDNRTPTRRSARPLSHGECTRCACRSGRSARMRVRQSGGFLDVAPLAGVVLLPSAWPYRLLAFPAWTRLGWVSRTVLPGDRRGLPVPGRGCRWLRHRGRWRCSRCHASVSGCCPARACGWHWRRQLPLDTRHPGHHERHENDGDDDQADEDHGLLPSGDPGVAGRRRRMIPGACSSPHAGSKKLAMYF